MIKRKQVIINPKIQFKLVALIVFTAIFPIALLFIGFMLYSAGLLSRIPSEHVEMAQIIESVQYLNFLTFGGFLVILIVIAVAEVLFLHKIVGPIYRIETDIEEMLKTNNLSRRITIREKDYVHSLVAKINALLDRFQGK